VLLTSFSLSIRSLSDDTLVKRPIRIEPFGALLRVLGGPGYSISLEFRQSLPKIKYEDWVSNEVKKTELHGEISTFKIANVSGCNSWVPHYEPVCYNRHIDGPLYLLRDALAELRNFSPNMIPHPGLLEGVWTESRNSAVAQMDDYTIVLEDNVVFNTDFGGPTTREENFGKEIRYQGSVTYGKELRLNFSKAIAAGCRQAVLTPQNEDWLGSSSELLRWGNSLPWNCPENVQKPENQCVHACSRKNEINL
jgi:hypothetical protein